MSSKAIITHVNASSVTTSAFAQALTTHTNLQATDILLLSAILDKYFIDGLSDAAAIAFAKALPDSFTMDEAATISVAKTLADSQPIADTFTRVMSFVRTLANSASVSDAPAIALAKVVPTDSN